MAGVKEFISPESIRGAYMPIIDFSHAIDKTKRSGLRKKFQQLLRIGLDA